MSEDLQWPSLQHRQYVTRLNYSTTLLTLHQSYQSQITLRTLLISLATTTLSILKFLLLEQIIINSAITPNLPVTETIYLLTLLNPILYNEF